MQDTSKITPINRRPEGASPSRERGDRPARAARVTDRRSRWIEQSYVAQATAALDRQVTASFRGR